MPVDCGSFLKANLIFLVLAFIFIFVGALTLIANNIINSHQAKNCVLGRDDGPNNPLKKTKYQ